MNKMKTIIKICFISLLILNASNLFGFTAPKDTCEMKMPGEFVLVKTEASSLGISATWYITTVDLMQNVEVFRQEPGKEKFKKLDTPAAFFARNDSIFTVFADDDVEPYQWYRYYLVPVDFCDDEGAPSDTIGVASVAENELPVAQQIDITGLPESRSLELSWKYTTDVPVTAAHIFRAAQVEGPYAPVATLEGDADSWVDPVEKANENYYYYLIAETPFGQGRQSSIAFGNFVGRDVPLPPQNLNITALGDTAFIQWSPGEDFVSGYIVYRKDGAADSWINVSGITNQAAFSDTTEKVAVRTYTYRVTAVSDGFLESDPSATVFFRTMVKEVPPPAGLTTLFRDGNLHFIWDSYVEEFPWITDCFITLRYERGMTYEINIPAPSNSYFLEDAEGLVAASVCFASVDGLKSETLPFSLSKMQKNNIEISGLQAIKSGQGILIQWSEIAGDNIGQYKVIRESADAEPVILSTTRESQYLDAGIQTGVTYGYSVVYISPQGIESKPSEVLVVVN